MEKGYDLHSLQDYANRKSNQQDLGTIRCFNLCTEILERTSPSEVEVCHLGGKGKHFMAERLAARGGGPGRRAGGELHRPPAASRVDHRPEGRFDGTN